jgi:zinc transport system substrate-binding protein
MFTNSSKKGELPMLKKLLALALALGLTLALVGCGAAEEEANQADGAFTVAATTYPVYLFAQEVTRDVPDVALTLVIDQEVSCLHDYTLSVNNMKALEGADLILLNGAGLEDTMEDALASLSNTPQIDCAQGIDLLTTDEGEADPHIWLDPMRAGQMVEAIAQGLSQADPDHADSYEANAAAAVQTLSTGYQELKDQLSGLSCRDLITFHDGFAYFAQAFDLTILRAIEEEAGSEASAKEVAEITALVQENDLPAIFTERNGSDATAQLIARETGAAIGELNLMMSRQEGDETGIDGYLALLQGNIDALREVLE